MGLMGNPCSRPVPLLRRRHTRLLLRIISIRWHRRRVSTRLMPMKGAIQVAAGTEVLRTTLDCGCRHRTHIRQTMTPDDGLRHQARTRALRRLAITSTSTPVATRSTERLLRVVIAAAIRRPNQDRGARIS